MHNLKVMTIHLNPSYPEKKNIFHESFFFLFWPILIYTFPYKIKIYYISLTGVIQNLGVCNEIIK